MRPESFEKLESAEIKEIIDRCTKLKKEERYSVKELLQHDFFVEDYGIKVRLAVNGTPSTYLSTLLIYCRVPAGRRLQRTARAATRHGTRDPLVRPQVDQTYKVTTWTKT